MSRFRVLQFNMQFGQIWDEGNPDGAPVRLEATLEEIRRHNADIVMLQEVERAQPGGVQIDPPPNFSRLRAEMAGYHGWFSYPKADPRELPFGIGLAIFSRTPLRDPLRRDLPSPPIEFDFYGRRLTPTDRLLIGACTDVGGHDLTLFNTHLLAFFMLGSRGTINPFQRTLIAEQLAAVRGPALLTGDFNENEPGVLESHYSALGFETVQTTEVTWRRRPYVLDHIFFNRFLRCVGHQVVPTLASDHHALVADFEFVA